MLHRDSAFWDSAKFLCYHHVLIQRATEGFWKDLVNLLLFKHFKYYSLFLKGRQIWNWDCHYHYSGRGTGTNRMHSQGKSSKQKRCLKPSRGNSISMVFFFIGSWNADTFCQLQEKGIPWSGKCQDEDNFQNVKELLASGSVLMHSDDHGPLFLISDPSFYYTGALLSDRMLSGNKTSSWKKMLST